MKRRKAKKRARRAKADPVVAVDLSVFQSVREGTAMTFTVNDVEYALLLKEEWDRVAARAGFGQVIVPEKLN